MEYTKEENIDMAYAAGIIDGDGSFSIIKDRGKYYPCIQLSNSFKGMSEWLHARFGGSLRIKKPQKPHYKPLYVWSVRGIQGCWDLSRRISPFVKLKHQQNYLMECFVAAKSKNLEERQGEIYSLEMKKLNQELLLQSDTLCSISSSNSDLGTVWSYIAGIMDTEGSFSIKKEKPHSGSISKRYNPAIQLTMVPAEVLNFIRKNCCLGSYCIPKADCTTKGYAYKVSFLGKEDCINFISLILPYLKFKKEQALTLLKFCKEFGAIKHRQGGVPQEILEHREALYQRMRMLNNTPS